MDEQISKKQRKLSLALDFPSLSPIVVRLVKHPITLMPSEPGDNLSDCACSLSSFSSVSLDGGEMLSFANRNHELDKILKPGMGVIILDAPTGYGKSALLREAREQALSFGWACAYLELDKDEYREADHPQQILNAIADTLSIETTSRHHIRKTRSCPYPKIPLKKYSISL